ncbi:MAG: flagellar filament capping protein FliD, partial [Oscillospiraceae bacterium]|nr:flagellar filament capping protein FliD [Oscillospiraceae bacterium]
MASVSPAGSIYGSIVAKNKGIGGLATGLDTESLMEALTAGTRAKIAKQGQQKQIAQWKQTAYRGVVSSLEAFRTKWLDTSSATRITSNTFFNSYKANTTSNKVKVTTSHASTLGDITIESIKKLAAAHTIQGNDALTSEIKGSETIDLSTANFSGVILSLQIGDTDTTGANRNIKNIDLSSLNGETNLATFNTKLQALVDDAFGTKNGGADSVVNAKLNASGQLEISNDAGKVSVVAANSTFGLDAGTSNRVDLSTKLNQINGIGGNLFGDNFVMDINGTTIEAKSSDTLGTLISRINTSTAGVRVNYSNMTGKLEMTAKNTGVIHKIEMKDVEGNLLNQLFGASSASQVTSGGVYTNSQTYTGIADAKFVDAYNTARNSVNDSSDPDALNKLFAELEGMAFELKIGDSSGNFSSTLITPTFDDAAKASFLAGTFTLGDYTTALNKTIEDKFNGETAVKFTAAGNVLSLSAPAGKLVELKEHSTGGLDYLGFQVKDYSNRIDFANTESINSTAAMSSVTLTLGAEYEFNLTVNGETKLIKYTVTQDDLDAVTGGEDAKDVLLSGLNTAMKDAFGDKISSTEGNVAYMLVMFDMDDSNNVKLVTDTSLDVSVSNTGSGTQALGVLNIANNANNENPNMNMSMVSLGYTAGSTLNINTDETGGTADSTVTVTNTMTVKQFMAAVNASTPDAKMDYVDGKFVISSDNGYLKMSGTGNVASEMFGVTTSYETQAGAINTTTEAQNAEIEIKVNGVVTTVSESTNVFDFNGTKVEILEETEAGEKINIGITSDPDVLIEKIQDFIKDYNALVDVLNTLVKEKSKGDYPPLTDEQKADMTESEIEKW